MTPTDRPQSQPEVQQGEPTEAETHLNLTLCDLRLWIERHLQNLQSRQSGHPVKPNGWAVAEIPDWELRQKLSNVIKCQENEQKPSLKSQLQAVIWEWKGKADSKGVLSPEGQTLWDCANRLRELLKNV